MPAIHTRLASMRPRLGSAGIGSTENAVSVTTYAKSAYRLIAIAYVMSNVMSFVFVISGTAVLE